MINNQIIYGIHVIENIIINKPNIIEYIYIININNKINSIIKLANKLHIKCILIENIKTKNIYNFKKNENIICKIKNIFNNNINTLEQLIKKNTDNVVLILDKIQDTNNLGACIRTAEAAGVTCIIIIQNKSASITPTVIKVSCGAALFIPIIETKNIKKITTILKNNNFYIIGTSVNAEKNIYETKIKKNVAIILGNESSGLDEKIKKKCDILLKIPTFGKCGSLNLSVANGIILFEIKRQYNL